MKKLHHIFLLLLLLSGCTHSSYNTQLVLVDSLLKSHPDSALLQLRTMSFSSEADRMYHTLLLADAANKCYDTLPSDSLLREVAEFYDRHGTSNEQVRAHYLLGCAYRDLGEAPQALDCFHDAIDRADTTATDCDYRLMMSVYGQIANIFNRQNLPQDELEALERSGHFALLNKDTLNYIRSKELRLKAFDLLGDTSSVIRTCEEARTMYMEKNYYSMAVNSSGMLASIFIHRGELDKARALMQMFEDKSGLFDTNGNIGEDRQIYYNIKGTYYLKVGCLDSAEYYLRKLLPFNYRVAAYRGLLSVYQQKGQVDSAAKFILLYEEALDEQNNRNRTEAVHQMASMYNYQRYQKQADTEKMKNAWLMAFLFVLSFLFIIAVFVVFSIYLKNKRRKQSELQQLHRDYARLLAAYNKSHDELELLKSDTLQLKEKKEAELRQLREKIIAYKEKIHVRDISEDEQMILSNELVKLFHFKATGKQGISLPTRKEWKDLIRLFMKDMPVEKVVFCKNGMLTEMEIQTYVLLLLGFSDSESAVLQGKSAQSVNNAKSRINRRLFNDSSSATLLKNIDSLSGEV